MNPIDSLGLSAVVVLGGICLWTVGDIHREARSEARCTNNLRLIGRAISLYQDDFGPDGGAPHEMSPIGYGCPPRLTVLLHGYGLTMANLTCTSLLDPADPSYGYQCWDTKWTMSEPRLRIFRDTFRQKQEKYPLVFDEHHSSPEEQAIGPAAWLVLRFDGSVGRVTRPVPGPLRL